MWLILDAVGIITSIAKPNPLHKCFLHLLKIPYIIQIAASATSEMQVPSVYAIGRFRSNPRSTKRGIGITLAVNSVFKIIFPFAIKAGIQSPHAATIETATTNDHDKYSEVK